MAAPVTSKEEELAEASQWSDAPVPRLEEQELDLLACELWRRASCKEGEADDWLSEEEALRCHASCL